VGRLQYLRYGLGAVLVFVGLKMLVAHYFHIPTLVSLAVVFGLIAGSALLSLWASRREEARKGSQLPS
jgi:predicted tellurium resistance membrane protein TerC